MPCPPPRLQISALGGGPLPHRPAACVRRDAAKLNALWVALAKLGFQQADIQACLTLPDCNSLQVALGRAAVRFAVGGEHFPPMPTRAKPHSLTHGSSDPFLRSSRNLV